MAMYKQGYSDRKDESLGMKNGKESDKMQSYKSRRDESYGMSGVMGHASKSKKCDAFSAQKQDMGRMQVMKKESRGNPSEAWDYKY